MSAQTQTTERTATQLGGRIGSMRGEAYLYRLSEPLDGNEYVIVSAVDEPLGQYLRVHETYIFPANEQAEVIDWGELFGSLKDTTDHAEALAAAGYKVTA